MEVLFSLAVPVSGFALIQLWGLATLGIGYCLESRDFRIPSPEENFATVPLWMFILPGLFIALAVTAPTLAWIDERIDLFERVSTPR